MGDGIEPTHNTPRCQRTGGCCKALVASNALEAVNEIRQMSESERRRGNYTDEFVNAWETSAKFAAEAKRVTFTCTFLEGDNVCTLQDKKPGICSYSLSLPMLSNRHLSDSKFFSSKCGYLNGAPELLVKTIEAREKAYSVEEGSEEFVELTQKYVDLQREYRMTTHASIVDGKWVECSEPRIVAEES